MDDEFDDKPMNRYQAAALRRLLPAGTPIDHLSQFEATRLIRLHSPLSKWRDKPPTDKQRAFLERFTQWQDGLSRGAAAQRIDEILAYAEDLPGGLPRLEYDITSACLHHEQHPIERWREWKARSQEPEAAETQPSSK